MFKIETPRCVVTAWNNTPEERDALRRWTTDTEMMRYITGTTWTDADREKFFERNRVSVENARVCFGPVRLKATGEIVGIAGAQPLELVDELHLGWWVDRSHQRKGLGVELAQAALDHVVNVVNSPGAVAVIAPGNVASCRVAEKIGMAFVNTVRACSLETRWKDEDVLLYASHAA
jgi:RimJ/RimL family protein N-acetyltransferase